MSYLYTKVKEILEQRGQTFIWLSDQLGYSRQGLKNGLVNKTIKYEALQKIADTLHVPVINFFGERRTINELLGLTFLDDESILVLSKRYDKFMDQISFLQDYYIYNIIYDIKQGKRPEHPYKIRENKPEFLISHEEYDILFELHEKILNIPFSTWHKEWQEYIYNTLILEGFYFTIFDSNFLNIKEYLADGLVKDSEILKYWKEWKK